jgi:hypothetical protein
MLRNNSDMPKTLKNKMVSVNPRPYSIFWPNSTMPCSEMNPIPVPTALERQGANLFHTGLSARPRPARTSSKCDFSSRSPPPQAPTCARLVLAQFTLMRIMLQNGINHVGVIQQRENCLRTSIQYPRKDYTHLYT